MTTTKKTDDDQCSLICYKDFDENQIGTIRIRQQIQCSTCNVVRSTLSLYAKHCQENSHREKVKKLIENQCFVPSIYDRVIQFALQKNFHYQSEQFHFRYKPTEKNSTRLFEVTLVFQEKFYRRTGAANGQIRDELLRDLIADRAEEFDRLNWQMFWEKKQISLSNSNENQRDDVQQIVDELVTKSVETTDEFRNEKEFLSAIARRHFRKKNTFHCDVCSIFLTSEKSCEQHLHSVEHRKKMTNLFPWRQAMQESLISGRPFHQIIGKDQYDKYKQTLAEYLAPTTLFNRGRFLCAFCQSIFADQWALEKHLHSEKHRESNKTNHKDHVVRFANSIVLPTIFKLNGVNDVNEVPEEIRIRYQWIPVTRTQLDEDTQMFLRSFPFDRFEGVTQLTSHKPTRKHSTRSNKNNRQRSRPFQKPSNNNLHLNKSNKRPIITPQPVKKRFRPDLNHSFPGAAAPQLRPRADIVQYPYNSPGRYSNGSTNSWPTPRPLIDSQRHESFERSNFELRSIASNQFHDHHHHHQRHSFPSEPAVPFNNGIRTFNPPHPPIHNGSNSYPPPPPPPTVRYPPPLFGAFAQNPPTQSNAYSHPQRFPPFNGSNNHFERPWNGSSAMPRAPSYPPMMNKPFDGAQSHHIRGRPGPPIPNIFHRPL